MNKKIFLKVVLPILVVFLALIGIYFNSIATIVIEPGEVGVIENRYSGVEERILGMGWNWVIPYGNSVVKYSIMPENYRFSYTSDVGDDLWAISPVVMTKDGKNVKYDLTVKFRVKENSVVELHRDIGPDYRQKFVWPVISEALREVTSKHHSIELFSSSREEIAEAMNINVEEIPEKVGRFAVYENLYAALQTNLEFDYIDYERVEIKDIKYLDELR